MFESILSDTAGTLSIMSALECMGVSLVLGLVIALVHMKTSKHSRNFAISLVVLPLLVQVVMLMVNGNLGTSVAILGAFGLVRFRSQPGTSKEIVSIFFAMAVGLACGMGHIVFAAVVTAIISLILVILSKVNFGKQNELDRKLKIVVPEDVDYTEVFNNIFNKYTKSAILEKSRSINMGSMYELLYDITLKKDTNEKEFLDEIRVRNSNLNVSIQQVEEGVYEL